MKKGTHTPEKTKRKLRLAAKRQFADPAQREIRRIRMLGNANPSKRIEVREKIRSTVSITMKRPDVRKKISNLMREWAINHPNRKYSNTSIEKKVAAELTHRKIAFRQNIGLDNIKNVDFYLPTHKIVIECDGCFYHACPLHGKQQHHQYAHKNDAKNIVLLSNAGYSVFRFWEHDINESVEECINKLNIQTCV